MYYNANTLLKIYGSRQVSVRWPWIVRTNTEADVVYYDKICLKFASHHFLLYAVYICQKSLNFIYTFKCYQQKIGGSKNRNSRNPPKFTKFSVYVNLIPPSATKSTYMKRKLSQSNVSSHEINSFHEIQYCFRNPRICMHSMEIIRPWSIRVLKFKLEATSISSTVHIRQPDNMAANVADLSKFQKL